jgi:putative copper export protein
MKNRNSDTMAGEWIIFGLIKSLHDLLTAVWVGGIIVTAAAFLPAVKSTLGKGQKSPSLLMTYQNRLSILAIISMAGLWLSGLLLGRQSAAYSGLFSFGTPYDRLITLKHILTLAMVAVSLVRRFGPGRKILTFTKQQQQRYNLLLGINLVLGLGVIILSGLAAALG